MKIFFRVDGGGGVGMGHLMRCFSLAERFQQYGCTPLFLTKEHLPAIKAIQERAYSYTPLPPFATVEEDITQTLEKAASAAIVIADSYAFTSDYLQRLHGNTPLLAFFDDLMNRFLPVDAVLGNAYVTRDTYGSYLSKETLLLSGPAFLPMRAGFQNLPPKQIAPQLQQLLITFGGEDPLNYTQAIIEALEGYPKALTLDVVLGPAYTQAESCNALLARSRHAYRVYKNPASLIPLFQSVDLAIAPPSTTLWELLAAGTPALLVKTADNQNAVEVYAKEKEIARCTSLARLCTSLEAYEDPLARLQYSQKGQTLVDGKGAQRCVEALLKCYLKRAPIQLKKASSDPESQDSRLMWEWRNDPTTREMSRHSDWIPWETHYAWYKKASADPLIHMWIAIENTAPIGILRLDEEGASQATVSINISPQFRGRGKGEKILELGCLYGFLELQCDTLLALIKKNNAASQALFTGVGFQLEREEPLFDTYCRKL